MVTLSVLAHRYFAIGVDPEGLDRTGPNSVDTHRKSYVQRQQNLNHLLRKWDFWGCAGKFPKPLPGRTGWFATNRAPYPRSTFVGPPSLGENLRVLPYVPGGSRGGGAGNDLY